MQANTKQTPLIYQIVNSIADESKTPKQPEIRKTPQQQTKSVTQAINKVTPPEKPKTKWFIAPLTINLYKPNYILPYYYTFSPYQSVYQGQTPDDQELKSAEWKFQFSLNVPLVYIYNDHFRFNFAYSQLSYWQFYAPQSQYFRETDYEPELYMSTDLMNHVTGSIGIEHQSNGKGGDLERSWNRAYIQSTYNNDQYMLRLKLWDIIFRSESSDLHNPDIGNFMGYGEIIGAWKFYSNFELSVMLRSIKYPTTEIGFSFPVYGVIKGYLQFFSGYGQSLIEYNHHTNAIGIGITINNWI
ncbi:phospholipase A [Thiotrichales bacterium 19X7-9]|nr:phospholipase A [Thiotrichales bacterium 19X7-9]